jgi:glycosyltransferase involved in cell wall biosynthesis
MKLSVVIATLGGATLESTISSINSGTIIPDEILICIPNKEAKSIQSTAKNVNIINTKVRGQVAQRAFGFKLAKGNYVLQIDDDIILTLNCIEQLIKTISINKKYVVAPAMINLETGRSVYARRRYNPVVEKLYGFLMNGRDGYQPGTIDKAGTAVGVNADECKKDLLVVDWLPGGCAMHHRENLILDDFYPFKGKAFGEDVVHSCLLKKNGLTLLLDTRAKCELEIIPITEYTFKQFMKILYADYKVRKYLQVLKKNVSVRMYLFYILSVLGFCSKIIKKRFR